MWKLSRTFMHVSITPVRTCDRASKWRVLRRDEKQLKNNIEPRLHALLRVHAYIIMFYSLDSMLFSNCFLPQRRTRHLDAQSQLRPGLYLSLQFPVVTGMQKLVVF